MGGRKGRRGRRGQTLFDVIVVVVIVAGLGALVFSLLAVSNRAARRASCASNLKQLARALRLYAADNHGKFPDVPGGPMASLGLFFHGYITDGRAFRCPVAYEAKLITAKDIRKIGPPGPRGQAERPSEGDAPDGLTAGDPPAPGARASRLLDSAVGAFTSEHSDYGYDPDHIPAHDPGVAIAADKGAAKVNSPNHGGNGQNVLYINGKVEWHDTSDCGYKGDHIFLEGFDGEGPDPGEEFHSHVRW